MTRLAPREIADLVYRCCRVAGVDAGNAQRCGSNVMHGEIHRGGSVLAFLGAAAGGESAVRAFAMASLSVDVAEAGERSAIFDEPTPLAAISATLWHAALRGHGTPTDDDTGSANERVMAIELDASKLNPLREQEANKRDQRAMQHGVPVDSELVQQLTKYASGFLVSELVVDEALEVPDGAR